MTTPKKPSAKAKAAAQKKIATLNQHVAVVNDLMGRMRLGQRLAGIQYGGNRDIFRAAGYVEQYEETFAHYWGLYCRGDVAGRIVDMPAKTTWRTPPEIVEPEVEAPTKFMIEVQALVKRLRLWHYFERTDRLAGIGRYAVLMLGVRGVEDDQLVQPLESVRNANDIIYLSVYNEANAIITGWETDTGNPRYGMPKIYTLKTSNDTAEGLQQRLQARDLSVHASRVIHVAEDLLEDDVFGRPRLRRCLNRLFDLEKVAASTGESYWQNVTRILQAKIDPEAEVKPAQLTELDEKLGDLVHDLKRQFYGQGVELSWLQNQTPDPSQVADFYFSLIAGASGIPKRILFGSELGQLASTTDQETYLGGINERQEQFAEPMILRAFIDRMIALKALPKPQDEYLVVWPTLFEESDSAKADANLKRAQSAAALTPVGGDPLRLVEIDEESNVWLVPRQPADPVAGDVEASQGPEPTAAGGDLLDGLPPGTAAGGPVEDDDASPREAAAGTGAAGVD